MEAKFAAMRAEYETEARALEDGLADENRRREALRRIALDLVAQRQADT